VSKRDRGRYSIFPASALEDERLGNAAIRVLALLGTYTDRDGWCNPKQATIAKPQKLTRQAISRQIQILVETGYVEVEATFRRDGGRAHNRYRVVMDDTFRKAMRRKSKLRAPQPEVAASEVAGPRNLQVAGPRNLQVAARGNDPSFERTLQPPAEREAVDQPSRAPGANLRAQGANPRALGTNPRALAKRTARTAGLRAWASRTGASMHPDDEPAWVREELERLTASEAHDASDVERTELVETGMRAWQAIRTPDPQEVSA
jgi:hypothetical protein